MGRLDSQLDSTCLEYSINILSAPLTVSQCDTTVLEHNVLSIIMYRMSNQPSRDHTMLISITLLIHQLLLYLLNQYNMLLSEKTDNTETTQPEEDKVSIVMLCVYNLMCRCCTMLNRPAAPIIISQTSTICYCQEASTSPNTILECEFFN